jgi:hypothetical protein
VGDALMDRRDFLVAMMQALLLSLFPWLRTERGLKAAGQVAERYLFQLETSGYSSWEAVYAAACAQTGAKSIIIDDSIAPATIPAGTWDLSDVELSGAVR